MTPIINAYSKNCCLKEIISDFVHSLDQNYSEEVSEILEHSSFFAVLQLERCLKYKQIESYLYIEF